MAAYQITGGAGSDVPALSIIARDAPIIEVEADPMNLKDRLGGDEARLKVLVDRLSAATGTTAPALVRREEALSALVAQLAETRLFLDDFLSGRSAHERAVLLYKIRVEYPLFSHLDALASLSSEFVDWSANDFSLTPASPQ